MSGGGSQDSTTTAEPWAGQQPHLRNLMNEAQRLYSVGSGGQFYGGDLVADFSDPTRAGLNQMTQRGMDGSQIVDPTQNYLTGAMRNPSGMAGVGMGTPGSIGDSMSLAGVGTGMPGDNPYLDTMVGNVGARMGEQFQDYVAPNIAAQFGGAGRTGSNIHRETLLNAGDDMNRAFGEQAANIYGADYSQAMDRDISRRELASSDFSAGMGHDVDRRALAGDLGMTAAGLAPTVQSMQMADTDQLLRAGAMTEDQAQREIDANRQRFDFYQQSPWQRLGQYAGVVNGMPSFASSSTTGPGPNRAAGLMGGSLAGAGLAGSVGALNPYVLPMTIGGGLLGVL